MRIRLKIKIMIASADHFSMYSEKQNKHERCSMFLSLLGTLPSLSTADSHIQSSNCLQHTGQESSPAIVTIAAAQAVHAPWAPLFPCGLFIFESRPVTDADLLF